MDPNACGGFDDDGMGDFAIAVKEEAAEEVTEAKSVPDDETEMKEEKDVKKEEQEEETTTTGVGAADFDPTDDWGDDM